MRIHADSGRETELNELGEMMDMANRLKAERIRRHEVPEVEASAWKAHSQFLDRELTDAKLSLANMVIADRQAKAPSQTAAPKENPNDKRDEFAYTSLKAGKSLQVIKNKINNRRAWQPLESLQGVSAAAKRYALRQRPPLPWPVVQR